MVIEDVKVSCIPEYGDIKVNVVTPKHGDSKVNISISILDTLHTLETLAVLYGPASSSDTKYQKKLLETKADFSKLMENDLTYALKKPILDSFMSGLTFDLKFPFKKVWVD